MALMNASGAPELLLLWGGVVLLPQLLQQGEVPCADEITPPPESRRRAFLALVVVANMMRLLPWQQLLACTCPRASGFITPAASEAAGLDELKDTKREPLVSAQYK